MPTSKKTAREIRAEINNLLSSANLTLSDVYLSETLPDARRVIRRCFAMCGEAKSERKSFEELTKRANALMAAQQQGMLDNNTLKDAFLRATDATNSKFKLALEAFAEYTFPSDTTGTPDVFSQASFLDSLNSDSDSEEEDDVK